MRIKKDCDEVFPGIIIGNGDSTKNVGDNIVPEGMSFFCCCPKEAKFTMKNYWNLFVIMVKILRKYFPCVKRDSMFLTRFSLWNVGVNFTKFCEEKKKTKIDTKFCEKHVYEKLFWMLLFQVQYLIDLGVTHVLNTAESDVRGVNYIQSSLDQPRAFQ